MNSDDDRSSISSSSSRTKSIKGSFRRHLRSIGSTADRGRHSIIDGTKTVSSKIVKKALRQRTSCDIREIVEDPKADTASLPASEIFDSIQFNFPEFPKFEETDFSSDDGPPPPQYPPPALPERFYDDVSDRSSNSCSDSQYELLEKCKRDATDAMDIPLYTRGIVDLESETLSSSVDESINDKFGSIDESFANLEFDTDRRENKTTFESFFSSSETSSSSRSTEVKNFECLIDRHFYENWNLKLDDNGAKARTSAPLKSVINEFDPLFDNPITETDDLSLENVSLLFNTDSKDETLIDAEEMNKSLPTINELYNVHSDKITEISSKGKRKNSIKSSASIAGWANMKKAVKAVSEVSSWSPNVIRRVSLSLNKNIDVQLKSAAGPINKPEICNLMQASLHNGYLFKSVSAGEKLKDFVKRWCQVSEGKLYYSVDKDSIKESIDLNSVLSICLVKDMKQNGDGEDMFCFEITTLSTKNKGILFAAKCSSERCVWMQKLLENLTPIFPARFTSEFTRAGWCFLKEGINGNWTAAYLLLQRRTLKYTRHDELLEVDLRKARYVGLQDMTDAQMNDDNTQTILLDTVTQSLYIITCKAAETVEWQRTLRSAATNNSIGLEDQQLTKDDIPVVVEKCINFIYAHGSMSEGIYRRSGSLSNVTKLLSLFRQDSWSVQLSTQEYTEHDVANVLKRFFRDLPEPLFTSHLHLHLCNAAGITAGCTGEDKLSLYRSILEQLKPINYVTVRKLIAHLYFIHEQHEKNLMPVGNLAAIWGPTLMHVENNESSQWSKKECQVIYDLISDYPKLFLVDEDELQRERQFKMLLETYHSTSTPSSFKPSGDLKVWIHLNSKDSGKCVHVTIDPNKCCDTLCEELAPNMNTQSHLLCLNEVICNETMKRPLHHKERVLEILLRWGYWDEEDRKNNYLLLTTHSMIREVLPLAKPPLTISRELKFADRKMKSFKNFLLEVSEGKLCCYKDKKNLMKMKEWNIKDIIWYDGFESKRDPHSRWTITFINKNEKPKRCKETPFFGYTIAGSQKEEQLRWIAAILLAQHSVDELLPPVMLLN